MAPQSRGVKNSKEETTTNSWTPKTFLLCYFVVIIVQTLYAEIKATLLKSFKMKKKWKRYELWK
jgi:hypothetical protein